MRRKKDFDFACLDGGVSALFAATALGHSFWVDCGIFDDVFNYIGVIYYSWHLNLEILIIMIRRWTYSAPSHYCQLITCYPLLWEFLVALYKSKARL